MGRAGKEVEMQKVIIALLIAITILLIIGVYCTARIDAFLRENDHVIWYIERFISDYGDKLGLG